MYETRRTSRKMLMAALLIFFSLYSSSWAESVELTLSGSTSLPAIVNGTITLKIGDEVVVETATDDRGNYTASFECDLGLDDVILLKANGDNDSQPGISMGRITDSCSKLYERALASSTGEIAIGTISPISSLVYAVLFWRIEDRKDMTWPPTRPNIIVNRNTMNFADSTIAVSVIMAVVNGDLKLPNGVADTLELIIDRETLVGSWLELAKLNPGKISQDLDALLWNPNVYKPFTAPTPPNYISLGCPALLRWCSEYLEFVGNDVTFSILIPASPQRRFEVITAPWKNLAEQDIVFTSQFEVELANRRAARIENADQTPLVEFTFPTTVNQESFESTGFYQYLEYREFDASELVTVFGKSERQIIEYAPESGLSSPRVFTTTPAPVGGLSNADHVLPWSGPQPTSEEPDVWVLTFPILGDLLPQGFPRVADEIVFNENGTANAQISGQQYEWSFADNTLLLTNADETISFQLLGQLPSGHSRFIATRSQGEDEVSLQVAGLDVETRFEFTGETIVGRYISGLYLDAELPFLLSRGQIVPYFTIELASDQKGLSGNVEEASATSPLTAINGMTTTWRLLEDGSIEIQRAYPEFNSSQWRTWRPLSIMENGDLYVIERLTPFQASDQEQEFASYHRLNFYRRYAGD